MTDQLLSEIRAEAEKEFPDPRPQDYYGSPEDTNELQERLNEHRLEQSKLRYAYIKAAIEWYERGKRDREIKRSSNINPYDLNEVASHLNNQSNDRI